MSTTSLALSLGDPLICLNTSCNYPFGRICEDCSYELESRATLQVQSQSRSGTQVQEKRDSSNKNRVTRAQTTLPRSTTVQSRSLDIPQRVADIVEDLQEIFAFVPAAAVPSSSSSSSVFPAVTAPVTAPAIPKAPSKLTTQNLQSFDSTSFPHPPLPLFKPHSTSTFTSSSSHSSPHSHNSIHSPTLNAWLDDIIIRTLEGQVLAPLFVGGANEQNEQEVMCPYCDSSMGEGAWRELHLINCRYAHIEAEKLEIARGRC